MHYRTFTVIDADVTADSIIMAQVAHKSPSNGRDADEILAEVFDIKCKPANGSFEITLHSLNGQVNDRFIVNYSVYNTPT
jgi:hypothetical protein